ncbi:RHS repeat-associated core domain-containing protein [Listeria goaensis]|uniref:RHS repeat-associated core domain-containing protein n=1 Tax=Listeria goaensis TaxID=1649188 RepID=UPI001F074753|nr:RHS repeat-associated core domain-containing protein [Listeria goaensis]
MARYYEPAQGVFTAYAPDPGDEDDPQTMNGYNYANNNPVNKIDSDGHFWEYVAAASIGTVFGVAKYYIGNKIMGRKSTWKGVGWTALKESRLMWLGVGRVFGVGSKIRIGSKIYKNKGFEKLQVLQKNCSRLKGNPRKHLSKAPGKRAVNVKKLGKIL